MAGLLITGATGNVGRETLRALVGLAQARGLGPGNVGRPRIVAAVQDVPRARGQLQAFLGPEAAAGLELASFDFEAPGSIVPALAGIDRVFLLRPPHLSQVDRYFRPLIDALHRAAIREIAFLSVQGAEKSRIIPHNQIERLIVEAGMDYVFLRPGYFMQNLTSTLRKDIREKRAIVLPAGRARFNWVDVADIGEVAARVLLRFEEYRNRILEITGPENLDFTTVVERLNAVVPDRIGFQDPNPLSFYVTKRREGVPHGMAVVLILLHYLQRFQAEPRITGTVQELLGRPPATLDAFLLRNRPDFLPPGAEASMEPKASARA